MLQSGTSHLITLPNSRTKTYCDRALSILGPRLWNELPAIAKSSLSLYAFKKKLKSHLLKIAFDV